MLKYDFENNIAIVDQPSIWKISNSQVQITHASGTDSVDIPSNGQLTVQVGNIDSITSIDSPNSSYTDNTGNNTGNNGGSGSGSSSGNDNPSQGGNDNPGGSSSSDTPTGEEELVYGSSTTGSVNMSIILNNTSNENIYITGHMYIAVRTADDSDWGPIHVNLVPYSKGAALYYVPAKTSVTIPSSKLDIFVNGNKEPVSKYYGGHIFYFSPGKPVYWRVYSWTDAHDPAVVESTPGTFNFTNGGSIEFTLTGTNEAKEGVITRSTNPIDLTTWQ